MKPEKIAEHCKTDPRSQKQEQEFSINFTKDQEKASVYTTISSQCKRLLNHTDVEITNISTFDSESDTYKDMTPDEFQDDGRIVWGVRGKVPIESLKIQATPRGTRSYAAVISPQNEVNFDKND